MLVILLGVLALAQGITAHVGAYGPGMYCRNGFQDADEVNAYEVSKPLYQLSYNDWWLHGRCKDFPPPDGEFLDLPANKSFRVELACNRANTEYFSTKYTMHSDWPDGKAHDELENYNGECIVDPNLHTTSEHAAAGTAFGISYTSDISAVTPENLVVFTVHEHTPWKRVVYYSVPELMPPCPEGGCICVYGWVANGCGQPNIFLNPFRCRVTGASNNTTPVGTPKPPVWCESDDSKCVKGPKQMIYWHQSEGNNIEVPDGKSPGYNTRLGFNNSAQNDIFEPQGTSPSPRTETPLPPNSKGVPTSSNTPSSTYPPANSGTTTTTTETKPSSCKRSRADLLKRSSLASHKRRHARRQSKRSN